MKWPLNPLDFNPSSTAEEITSFINEKFSHLNRRKAIIGLSGGLDSSLTSLLAVKALGSDSVRLIYMPERDSKPVHRKHARLLAQHIQTDLRFIDISPILRRLGIYRLLPLSLIPGQRLKARLIEFGKKEFLSSPEGEFLSVRLDSSGGPDPG